MHTLLDLRGAIPAFIHISDGKMHDVKVQDMLPIEAGAFYVMDCGDVDFQRLYAPPLSTSFCRRLENPVGGDVRPGDGTIDVALECCSLGRSLAGG